jgi:hypothetical protein
MKLLSLCLLAIVGSVVGIMMCEGTAMYLFQFSAFAALATTFVLLVIGQFN